MWRFDVSECLADHDAVECQLRHGFGDQFSPFHDLPNFRRLLGQSVPLAILVAFQPAKVEDPVVADALSVLHEGEQRLFHILGLDLKVEDALVLSDVSKADKVWLTLILDHSNAFGLV